MTKPVSIHMIGVGGIGMSALALILDETGYSVTGSDIEENDIIKKLRGKGMAIGVGHNASRVNDRDLVVFSSSIRADNPEILQARKNRTKVISRTELLKMVMEKYERVIGITGTHGKTTITAMTAHLLEEAGFDPTALIGGESPHFAGNAKLGKSGTLVAEVDESDGRLVHLTGLTHAIIPNLEREHLEHYGDERRLLKTFERFFLSQSPGCRFFYGFEDLNLKKLLKKFKNRAVSFGFSKNAFVSAGNIKTEIFRTEFDCFLGKTEIGRFTVNLPGRHNISNALAAISLGAELKIDAGRMIRAIASYRGVKRRFEVIGNVNGASIIEDYAHHPTEIKATISAACSLKPRRLITVFQPHRYTRTKSFYKEFSGSFEGSDEVILAEVYPASEDKIEGASSLRICEIMKKRRSIPVRLMETGEIRAYLSEKLSEGDIALVLGAGNIGKIAHDICRDKR